jgi:Ca-activated chloride channel family protein
MLFKAAVMTLKVCARVNVITAVVLCALNGNPGSMGRQLTVKSDASELVIPQRYRLVLQLETEQSSPATSFVQNASPQSKAPTAAPGAYKLSVDVRMVVVDAVVRDRTGRIMENLKMDDFRVYEDRVEQPIRDFSRDELPLAVALVIDQSGSVSPYIDELRRIASKALTRLKPYDEVALYSFDAGVDRLEDLTTEREKVAESIAHLRAEGGTDIVDALAAATTYLAKAAPGRRRAVILVSDNQATIWPRTSEADLIRRAMETETVIYSLRTSSQAIPFTMQLPNVMLAAGNVEKVARETGGEVINVRDVSTLDDALGSVVSRLRLRYALDYVPPAHGKGEFHVIDVRLVNRFGRPGKDYFIHARRGYYSTASPSIPARNP